MNTSEFRRLTREAEAMIEAAEARERELAVAAEMIATAEARQQEVAEVLERLSQDPAVQAAFQQGVEHERGRVLTLISIQLDMLNRGGTNALVLDALRRQVREAQS